VNVTTRVRSVGQKLAMLEPDWRRSALRFDGRWSMRYLMAWIFGVPFGVIVLWYIVGHAACR
jgi:hypothetical protein